MALD
ncbi:hypothetical protein VCHC56A1_3339, partial [Vibrio cholerae HC-56A1]